MFRTCFIYVLDMFRTCSRHVSHMFQTYFGHVSDMFQTCFGHVSDMFRGELGMTDGLFLHRCVEYRFTFFAKWNFGAKNIAAQFFRALFSVLRVSLGGFLIASQGYDFLLRAQS